MLSKPKYRRHEKLFEEWWFWFLCSCRVGSKWKARPWDQCITRHISKELFVHRRAPRDRRNKPACPTRQVKWTRVPHETGETNPCAPRDRRNEPVYQAESPKCSSQCQNSSSSPRNSCHLHSISYPHPNISFLSPKLWRGVAFVTPQNMPLWDTDYFKLAILK